jgi:hypothetical protein
MAVAATGGRKPSLGDLPLSTAKEVQDFFQMSTYTVLGNGRSTAFWTGRWI